MVKEENDSVEFLETEQIEQLMPLGNLLNSQVEDLNTISRNSPVVRLISMKNEDSPILIKTDEERNRIGSLRHHSEVGLMTKNFDTIEDNNNIYESDDSSNEYEMVKEYPII